MKKSGTILSPNKSARVYDLGDDVIGMEITSKNGTINRAVIESLHNVLDEAEGYNGLVIHSRHGPVYSGKPAFSLGADLKLIIGLSEWALKGNKEERSKAIQFLDNAVREFQRANYRMKFSNVPIVVA